MENKGVLTMSEDAELFGKYQESEVRDVLSLFEEELDFRYLQTTGSVYLIPSFTNTVLGMSLREYREDLGTTTRLNAAFMNSYIQMIIFWLFFGGKNPSNPKQRDFIQMDDLIEEVDAMFKKLKEEREDVLEFDSTHRYNFTNIAEDWLNRQYGGEGQEISTKYGTVRKAVNQLARHNLLTLVENEVRPTRELTDKFVNYYLNEDRVREINELFDRVKGM